MTAMTALEEAQALDPTITLENVAEKVGLRRYAILREADPEWKHKDCSMGRLCPWR